MMTKHNILTFILTNLFLTITGFNIANASSSVSLYVGQSTILSAPNPPSGSAINQTAWGSSSPHLKVEKYMETGAKITVQSYFTGIAQVQCDYYYFWYDHKGFMHTNNATTYFDITCNPVNVSINPTSMQLNVGDEQKITYSYSPQISPTPTFHFYSSNNSVATVNSNGYVTALKSGHATITLENNAGPSATCEVNIKSIPPTSISLPSSKSIIVGDELLLEPTIYPTGAEAQLDWTSNDNSIATVSNNGLVKAKKKGSVKITVKIKNSNLSDYCTIEINNPKLSLRITPDCDLIKSNQTISIIANEPTASIYYTLDGTPPNNNSTEYTQPFSLNKSATINAMAYHDDYMPSDVISKTYMVTSLEYTETFPTENSSVSFKEFLPCITFNKPIEEGDLYESINLTTNEGEIAGESKIFGNKVVFIPHEFLTAGEKYLLTLPQGCIKSIDGEINTPSVLSFEILSEMDKINPYVKVKRGAMLKKTGELYLWGYPYSFQYPDPNQQYSSTPILFYNDIVDYVTPNGNSYILKEDNTLLGWGKNYDSSQSTVWAASCSILGDGTQQQRKTPVVILNDVREICPHSYHMAAIKTDNSLWGWGRNNCGQIGNGEEKKDGQLYPVNVLDNVKSASLGNYFTVALKNDESLWAWGILVSGGKTTNTPQKIMTEVQSISCSDQILALKKDGTLWGWGSNDFGEVGDGTEQDRSTPFKIMSDVTFMQASPFHSLAIKKDGSLWRWGLWSNGFKPEGYQRNWLTPKKVLTNVTKAIGNSSNCFALKSDGSLWGMGDNKQNELGNDLNDYSPEMIKIIDNVVDFWFEDTCYALKSDGSVWSWGGSILGNGTNKPYKTPTKIFDEESLTEVSDIEILVDKNLYVGQQSIALPILNPIEAHIESIEWKSYSPDIASISDNGLITAYKEGTCMINLTVTTPTQHLSSSVQISVNTDSDVFEIYDTSNDSKNQIFDLRGMQIEQSINSLQPGIYIVRKGPNIRKIVIK